MIGHRHTYDVIATEPSWWRRLLGAQTTYEKVCPVCMRTIDEIIHDLEAELKVVEGRLREILDRHPRPFDHGDGDYCEEDHP